VQDDRVVNIASAESASVRGAETDGGWILQGKLAPPQQRVTTAQRTALLGRLDNTIDSALSVIVSPPGFGKTTLLTQWWQALRSRPGIHTGWLTLDESDAEPGRFMADVILAVGRSGADIGALEVSARQPVETDIHRLAAGFLAQIQHSARRIVLILDDYHRTRSQAVDRILELLIENGHPTLHLVISSREKPTLRVSALSMRGLVTAIDATDLVMSEAEASELVGPEVSSADITLLHARTEGWPVALQLARLWLDRGQRTPDSLQEFFGRTTEMTDYLAEQVIQDLPADLREFLLETSILERFDASLADAVRARTDSAELLERLLHLDALLMRIPGTHDSFRYHIVFSDFLQQRLHRGPAGRVATYHRRAARWLAEVGDLLQAVQHGIKAGDSNLAVELVHNAGGWELILWRGVGYVQALLRIFSDMAIRANPVLQLTQASLYLKSGQYEDARELLALAKASLDSAGPKIKRDYIIIDCLAYGYTDDLAAPERQHAYAAEVEELSANDHLGRGTLLSYTVLSSLANGDLPTAERASRSAIREMRAAGSILGVNCLFLHLGQSQLLGGKLREAEALYREALIMAEEDFGTTGGLKASSTAFLSESLYLRDDLVAAAEHIGTSCEAIETTDGWLDAYTTAYSVMLRLAYADGNLEYAQRVIARAAESGRRRHFKRLAQLASAWRVENLVIAGELKDARREAKLANLNTLAEARGKLDFNWRAREAATVAMARLSIVSGASAQALNLLDGATADFRAAGLHLPAYRFDALSIVASKRRGGSNTDAVTRLETLIQYIVDEGASRLVIEHGEALESLLHIALRRNRALVLSSAQRDVMSQLIAKLNSAKSARDDGFNAREMAVLRELCNGRSNKVIGQLLDLSENTVKFHLKRIFKKLEVESRAAAISTAMATGLVDVAPVSRAQSMP
jgi:LuxR family transcriptional regulator, maltose regulon positive regulatory protein